MARFSRRSSDEPSDDDVQPGDRAGTAQVDAISAGVVERGSEAFDRMFACAKQQLQAEVQLGRPWGFEAVLMAVLVAHERRVVEVVRRIEELKALSRA